MESSIQSSLLILLDLVPLVKVDNLHCIIGFLSLREKLTRCNAKYPASSSSK